MSRENVELVQSAYDAYFRGDVQGLLELVAPDVVVEQPPEQPDVSTYEGHDGLLKAMADWTGAWEDFRIEVLRMIDAGAHVLVTVRQGGRGHGSGIEIEDEYTFIHTIEDGKVVRWRMFRSEREALEAVGLPE